MCSWLSQRSFAGSKRDEAGLTALKENHSTSSARVNTS